MLSKCIINGSFPDMMSTKPGLRWLPSTSQDTRHGHIYVMRTIMLGKYYTLLLSSCFDFGSNLLQSRACALTQTKDNVLQAQYVHYINYASSTIRQKMLFTLLIWQFIDSNIYIYSAVMFYLYIYIIFVLRILSALYY